MKWIKLLAVFIFFISIFQSKIGIGQYYHNDGVTILCSKFTWFELLHPGTAKTLACSYDHQPLYHYLVKLIGPIVNYNLYIFQILNVLFVSLASLVLFNIFIKELDLLASLGISLIFFTTYSILYEIQELRMYSLFLLSSTFITWLAISEKRKWTWLHVLSFYNFYLYIIPLGAYFLENFKKIKRIFLENKKIYTFLLIAILYKTPFVLFWRVKERYQIEPYSFDFFKNQIIGKIFEGNLIYTCSSSILALVSLTYFLRTKNIPAKKFNVFNLAFAVATVLIFTLIFQSQEIEWRYFCFIYPCLSYIAFMAVKSIDKIWIQRLIGGFLIIISIYNSKTMFIRGERESIIHQKTIDFILSKINEHSFISVDYNFFYEAYIDVFLQQKKKINYKFSEIKSLDKKESYYISSIQTLEEHIEECMKRFGNCKIILNEMNIIGNQRTIISEIN